MRLLQLDAGVMTRESGVGVVVYERCRAGGAGNCGCGGGWRIDALRDGRLA